MITSLIAGVVDPTTTAAADAAAAVIPVYIGLTIAFYLIFAIALMGIFRKAGEPVWQAFVPIWSTIVLLKVAGKPAWWIILLFIPLVGLVVGILLWIALSEAFGHGAGFVVGLIFLPYIFLFILGYSSNEYRGGDRAQVGYATA